MESCIIRVRGHLTAAMEAAFEGLTASHETDGSTRLDGSVCDQSELQGHLRRIERFGLTLMEVRVGAGDDASSGGES